MQDPRPQMVKTKTILAKTKTIKNGHKTKTSLKTFIIDNGDKLHKYAGILDWMSAFITLGETVSNVLVA